MKNGLLKYLVIAALLINAVTLIFFWLRRPQHPRPPFELLIKELAMNEEQQNIFKTLREQHHRTHDSLLQVIADKRKVLYVQKPSNMDSILQQIGLLQQEIEVVTYRHFQDVKKICTPEQQSKLDNLLLGAVQHVLVPQDNKRPPKRE